MARRHLPESPHPLPPPPPPHTHLCGPSSWRMILAALPTATLKAVSTRMMVSSLTAGLTCSASTTSAGLLTWWADEPVGRSGGGVGGQAQGFSHSKQPCKAPPPPPSPSHTHIRTHLDIDARDVVVGPGRVPVPRVHRGTHGAGTREGAARQDCGAATTCEREEAPRGSARGPPTLPRTHTHTLAPTHSLCGMTSISSRGGPEAGAPAPWSSRWLPRLTTCGRHSGGSKRGAWSAPAYAARYGRTPPPSHPPPPTPPPDPPFAILAWGEPGSWSCTAAHAFSDTTTCPPCATSLRAGKRAGEGAAQQSHPAQPIACRQPRASASPPHPHPLAAPRHTPELLHPLHASAQVVGGGAVGGGLLAWHADRGELAALVQRHGDPGALEDGLAVGRQHCSVRAEGTRGPAVGSGGGGNSSRAPCPHTSSRRAQPSASPTTTTAAQPHQAHPSCRSTRRTRRRPTGCTSAASGPSGRSAGHPRPRKSTAGRPPAGRGRGDSHGGQAGKLRSPTACP